MTTVDIPRARRRFVIVALIVPAVLTVVAVLVQLAVLPQVPATIATHWRADGTADGFAPAWTVPLLTAAVGLGLPALLAISGLTPRRAAGGSSFRFLGAMALGLAGFLTPLTTASLLVQRGVADSATVEFGIVQVLPAAALGFLAGIAGWFAQPHLPAIPSDAAPASALTLAAGERAAWVRSASISRAGRVILIGAVVLIAVVTGIAAVTSGDPLAAIIGLTGTLLVAGLVLSNARFRVRVDETGLSVTSALGFPRIRVPATDVREAEVVDVAPMADFGGWGMRWAPDRRFGVVLRTGEGIHVRRRDGRTFTVTVEDAATGAALLNTYAGSAQRDPAA